MSRVVGAYGAPVVREEVDFRPAAGREANFLLVRSNDMERLNNHQTSDHIEDYELTDEIAPGQPCYDRKKAVLKTAFYRRAADHGGDRSPK